MLDDFDDIRLRDLVFFDRLAALGSISAAGRELGVPKPTASRWLAGLEDRLGQPLVVRGARPVVLTEVGRVFHHQLQPVLTGTRALRAAIRDGQPGGTLRVSVPVPLGRLVGGAVIATFRRRMPGVRLEVRLDNARVDLLRDRIDLAIRGGAMPDSSLVARHLATVPLWLYASAGVGVLPAFLGEQARADGVLVRLDEQPLSTMPVHAVFLPEQRGDVRVRTLIELISEELERLQGDDRPPVPGRVPAPPGQPPT